MRFSHFPNITHAQALIGHHTPRSDNDWFEQRLGPDVQFRWFVYNAGPTAMEVIFADSIDLTYVGSKSGPEWLCPLWWQEDTCDWRRCYWRRSVGRAERCSYKTPADLIATPEFGNTQDVASRVWLGAQGFKITLNPQYLRLVQECAISERFEAGQLIFLDGHEALIVTVKANRGLPANKQQIEVSRWEGFVTSDTAEPHQP